MGKALLEFAERANTIVIVPDVLISPNKAAKGEVNEEDLEAELVKPVLERIEELLNAKKKIVDENGKESEVYKYREYIHGKWRFRDPEFGSIKGDRYGAKSFYASGERPSKRYVNPKKSRWDRPVYKSEYFDDEEEEDEDEVGHGAQTFTDEARLWDEEGDGAAPNDVVQGKLGDCWFLGALSVMATRDDLLEKCYFHKSRWSEQGLYCLRFTKDCDWYYVIIDDTLPVYPLNQNAKPVFASARDRNEMWVPLIEKAYAKLHGSYDSLIGGYVDGGLKDMTGLVSEQLVLRPGHLGFHKSNEDDLKPRDESGRCALWDKFNKYLNEWGCLMGASIQPDPKSKNKRVEHGTDDGLFQKHAYSLLDCGELKDGTLLVRLRNPWGMKEWNGPWSDKKIPSDKLDELQSVFNKPLKRYGKGKVEPPKTPVVPNEKDGIFYMTWKDFTTRFTHIFAAVDFPANYVGFRIRSKWEGTSCGGNKKLKTWKLNPKFMLHVEKDNTHVYISLSQDDPRLKYGKNYAKKQDPLGFHICKVKYEDENETRATNEVTCGDFVEGSVGPDGGPEHQAPYKFHHSVDIDLHLNAGNYWIVPSTYRAKSPGEFYLSVYAPGENPISLQDAQIIATEYEAGDSVLPFNKAWLPPPPPQEEIDRVQRFEEARTRLLAKMKIRGVTAAEVMHDFNKDQDPEITYAEMKVNFCELGFKDDDFEDDQMYDDFLIFAGGDSSISRAEFQEMFQGEIDSGAFMAQRDGGDESLLVEDETTTDPGKFMGSLTTEVRGLLDGESMKDAVDRLTVENLRMCDELNSMKMEMQHMAGILLLYGRMFGCYNQPLPANVLAMANRPPPKSRGPLSVGPQAMEMLTNAASGKKVGELDSAFDVAAEEGGDEFMAVLPWKGSIHAPSTLPYINPTTPAKELDLEWVYGLAVTNKCHRNHVLYNRDDDIVYPAAAVGIVYKKEEKKQLFNRGSHDDDIVCFAMDKSGTYCATGQMGKPSYIVVWNARNGDEICVLERKRHHREVQSLAFSDDGTMLMSTDNRDDHGHFIWKTDNAMWTDGRLVASREKCCKGFIITCQFFDDHAVSMGEKTINWWDFTAKNPRKKGVWKTESFRQIVSSSAKSPDSRYLILGDNKGNLFKYKGRCDREKMVKDAHKKVTSIFCLNDTFLTGGSEGVIKEWGYDMRVTKTIDITQFPIDFCHIEIRSLCMDKDLKTILVATRGAEVFEMDYETEEMKNQSCIMHGHWKGELWALDTCPVGSKENLFVSGGDDSTVRVWDAEKHEMISSTKTLKPSRSLAFNKDGTEIAVGLGKALNRYEKKKNGKKPNGGLAICSFDNKEVKVKDEYMCKKKWTSAVRWHKNGLIAVGGHDNKVHIFRSGRPLKSQKKSKAMKLCKKSSSFITNLDFTENGEYIQTTDASYELLFYKTSSGKQQTKSSALKDMKWDTLTCALGWSVQGIWPAEADGTDINGTARSNTGDLLATVDDFGLVKLFNYPCVEQGSKFREYKGHSSHVTCARFSANDKWLFTTGGLDGCIFQWKITLDD